MVSALTPIGTALPMSEASLASPRSAPVVGSLVGDAEMEGRRLRRKPILSEERQLAEITLLELCAAPEGVCRCSPQSLRKRCVHEDFGRDAILPSIYSSNPSSS